MKRSIGEALDFNMELDADSDVSSPSSELPSDGGVVFVEQLCLVHELRVVVLNDGRILGDRAGRDGSCQAEAQQGGRDKRKAPHGSRWKMKMLEENL